MPCVAVTRLETEWSRGFAICSYMANGYWPLVCDQMRHPYFCWFANVEEEDGWEPGRWMWEPGAWEPGAWEFSTEKVVGCGSRRVISSCVGTS